MIGRGACEVSAGNFGGVAWCLGSVSLQEQERPCEGGEAVGG